MKLVYKELSIYEVLWLFEMGEPMTMSELIAKGAKEMRVIDAKCKGWIERCGNGEGMDETFQLTRIGYRARSY